MVDTLAYFLDNRKSILQYKYLHMIITSVILPVYEAYGKHKKALGQQQAFIYIQHLFHHYHNKHIELK